FTFHGVLPGKLALGTGWLDIDTGAYHPKSGWLTALDLDNRQVYQVNVFNNKERVLSFDEATTKVNPSPFRLPRQKSRL
ncbi:MAG TPA: serine/threonine protein phosphatase, partial [Allocoleopsis sp.]